MFSEKMTANERRAVISLSSIMGLRMVGLFMVLPVFSLYASGLYGATPALIGIAIGVYGLSQALFQIPFGALSDRFGRKPIILIGLIIFVFGSLIAAFSHSIYLMILGRALQGIGAVGSTILAMMADLTRENQRTKSMAIAGMTIGFSFSVAMFLGPMLTKWMTISHLFFVAMGLGMIAILILFSAVPTPKNSHWHRDAEPEMKGFLQLLIAPELAKLNLGIFILHAIFTASFVALPIALKEFAGLPSNQQWHFYLPGLLIAFVISMGLIGSAERKQRVKPYFLLGILLLILAESSLFLGLMNSTALLIGIVLFFTGFTLLEAFLPSLISRTAPAARKGSAMGIYSCSQFSGIFVGGFLGGWIYGQFSFSGVYIFCFALALFWFALAYFMQPPRYLVIQMLRFLPAKHPDSETIAQQLRSIPGMAEVTFIAEESMAYLKMERATTKHPDFIRLKERLQSE